MDKRNTKKKSADWMDAEQIVVYEKYRNEVQDILDGYKKIVSRCRSVLGKAYQFFNNILSILYNQYLLRKDNEENILREIEGVHEGINYNLSIDIDYEKITELLSALPFSDDKEKILALQELHDEVLRFIEKDSKLDKTAEQMKRLKISLNLGLNCSENTEINYTNQELKILSSFVIRGLDLKDPKISKLFNATLEEVETNTRFAKNTLALLHDLIEELKSIVVRKELESELIKVSDEQIELFKKILSLYPIIPIEERKKIPTISLPTISLSEIIKTEKEISDTKSECSDLDEDIFSKHQIGSDRSDLDKNIFDKYLLKSCSIPDFDELADDPFNEDDFDQMIINSENLNKEIHQENNKTQEEESWFQTLQNNVNERARLTLLPDTEMTLADRLTLAELTNSRNYS